MSVTQRQLDYLKAMGVPVWVSRDAVDVALFEPCQQVIGKIQSVPSPLTPLTPPTLKTSGDSSAEALISQLQGKKAKSKRVTTRKPVVEKRVSSLIDVDNADLSQLKTAVVACQQCELYGTRTQTVFGEGKVKATWMIISDAPREEDDAKGKPFLGLSGVLLDNMLAAVGLDRSLIYIAHTVKCRPPNNRDPKKKESKACSAYLMRQIQLINPRVILIVGRIAVQRLLQTTEPIARLRGRTHKIEGINIPVVVSYHPAYLLRLPRNKYKSWEDLKLARALLQTTTLQ